MPTFTFILLGFVASSLIAFGQATDTIEVRANSPTVFEGTYFHWQYAEYRWTVTGGGSIGNIYNDVEMEVDARFSLISLDLPGGIQYPKLPLNDNPAFGFLCGGPLLPQSACNVYLACNAPEDQAHVMEPLELSEADAMKRFAFRPDNDTRSEDGRYVLNVAGSDIQPEFMYVDRYDEESANIFYQDNVTLGSPTVFHVVTQRVSPEILAIHPNGAIVNDGVVGSVPQEVMRTIPLAFGAAPIQGPRLTYSRMLSNRGLNALEIDSIVVVGDVGVFSVERGDSRPLLESTALLPEFADSLELKFTFTPDAPVDAQAVVRVYCNDPTQHANDDERWFEFKLTGTGIAPGLAIDTLQNTNHSLSFLAFSDVRVGSQAGITVYVRSSGDEPVTGLRIAEFPSAPYSVARSWSGAKDLPVGAQETVDITFTPLAHGQFTDSLVLYGDNIGRRVIHFSARGLEAVAQIFQLDRPSFASEDIDTIFFGNVSPQQSVTKTFRVRNFGNIELYSSGKVTPYYSVNQMEGSVDNFDDAGVDLDSDGIVETGTPFLDRKFSVTFVPAASSPDTDPLGRKVARLEIQFRDNLQRSDIVVQKVIYLIGTRVGVTTDVNTLNFDSVAVNYTAIENVAATNYAFDEALISKVGMNNGFPQPTDFFVENIVGERVFQHQPLVIPVEYTPTMMGRDTAVLDLVFQYAADDKIPVQIPLYGVGVQQELKFERTVVSGGGVADYDNVNDTVYIDFGRVSVCADSKTVLFVHSLAGNISFHPESGGQYVEQVSGYDSDFVVKRKFEAAHVQPGTIDSTFAVEFRPLSSGNHKVYVTIVSDIGSRVRGVDSLRTRYVYCLTGVGVQAELLMNEDSEVDFGTAVYAESCVEPIAVDIVVTNPGNANLVIDSVGISPYTHFVLSNFEAVEVLPSSTANITVQYIPTGIGSHTALLNVFSNAFCGDTVSVALAGQATSVPMETLQLPSAVQVRTGQKVRIPIATSSATVVGHIGSETRRVEIDVQSNPTVVQEVSFIPSNASAPGSVGGPRVNSVSGSYSLYYTTPNGVQNAALGQLEFSTYLGNTAQVGVHIQDVRFLGANGCVLAHFTGESTALQLDSICGSRVLRYDEHAEFNLARISPNPAESDVTIRYSVGFKTHVRIEVRSISGELVYVASDGEHPAGEYEHVIPEGELPVGAFFVLYTADVIRETERLIVR